MHPANQGGASQDKISPTVYAALIDSLYHNSAALYVGAAVVASAAVMMAVKTGSVALWLCTALLTVAGIGRAIDMHRYLSRKSVNSVGEAARWEMHYQIGAILYAVALSTWSSVALLVSDDAVVHMVCLTVGTGYIAAGAGRTYGRPWIYYLQVGFSCGPPAVALALNGSPYYTWLSVACGVFAFDLCRISIKLQQIFVQALVAREREAALARQFDAALNNMPHGLCMFRDDGRLAVSNRRFSEMMGLPDGFVNRGISAATNIIAACVGAGSISAAFGKTILAEIRSSRVEDEVKTLVTTDPDVERSRSLCWTVQPMADGGAVVLVTDVTERLNAEARISHLARYDELTALSNRANFQEEVERLLAIRHDSEHLSALLFVDLDHFKQVNDTLGHPRGDQLLCAVANRLREMLRPEDFVARFGGDEFMVFQQNVNAPEDAAALACRIVDCLSERYRIDDHLVEISASVGIALATPDVTNFDTLLKNADMALYRAKAEGRGTCCFFREEMAASAEARRTLELDLRKALADGEFELFYQPLVDLKSGKITTCEALLRWNHPVRGMVSPADFIPVLEDIGMMTELGRWVLRQACIECMEWPEEAKVAVNLSPRQLHQHDVLNEIRDALGASSLPAHRLEIEITESSLLVNTQENHDILSQLHVLGVRISLDDFGTGYSSLSYLHYFPLQKVKIDRSFLDGIDTDRPLTLLRGVARLSVDLGMSVVVEGIETNEQLELISAEGTVTEVQGYLFSHPVPASRIRQLLIASHGSRQSEELAIGSQSAA